MTYLVGDNVTLRPVQEKDIPSLVKAFNDPQAAGDYDLYIPQNVMELETAIRQGKVFPCEYQFFPIERKTDEKVVGFILYFVPNCFYKNFEIGYRTHEPAERRKGYMTEAVKLLVDFLFRTKSIERIEAHIAVENIASIRVVEKVGFTKEGCLRKYYFAAGTYEDLYMFSILRDEWKASRKES